MTPLIAGLVFFIVFFSQPVIGSPSHWGHEPLEAAVRPEPVQVAPTHPINEPEPPQDCSCVKYARSHIPDLPPMRTPDDLEPNSPPFVGAAVLLDYKLAHIAVITEIRDDGYMITEANYKPCEITERFLPWDNAHLRGFYHPHT